MLWRCAHRTDVNMFRMLGADWNVPSGGMVHPIENDISGAGVAPVYNNTGCGYFTPGCLNSSHWEALYGLASNRSVCPSSAWVLPLLAG